MKTTASKLVAVTSVGMVLLMIAGCQDGAVKRVKRHFAISGFGRPSTNDIRTAVLSQIPIGTSEQDLRQTIDTKMETDSFSSFFAPTFMRNTNGLIFRVGYKPGFRFVNSNYDIRFLLDTNNCVRDVQVEVWHMGL